MSVMQKDMLNSRESPFFIMDPIKAVRLRALILFMRSPYYLTKSKCTLCNFTVDLHQKAKEGKKKKKKTLSQNASYFLVWLIFFSDT